MINIGSDGVISAVQAIPKYEHQTGDGDDNWRYFDILATVCCILIILLSNSMNPLRLMKLGWVDS
jgi:hypothetical protein